MLSTHNKVLGSIRELNSNPLKAYPPNRKLFLGLSLIAYCNFNPSFKGEASAPQEDPK